MHILLVSTQKGIQEDIERVLAELPGDLRLFWVTQPDLALVRASDLAPDAIIVDDALGDADLVDLIGQLTANLPTSALLILVEHDALETARRAILQGARGFVTKPIVPDELRGALRRVLEPRKTPVGGPEATPASGRVVVFCAPKGGTGRTTLAINTAISLRQFTDVPVALVDADYAAPAIDVALNLRAQRDVSDLASKMTKLDAELVAGVLTPHKSGLQVLLAPPPASLDRPLSLPYVQQVLVWLKRMFPWVMVDLGLPLDETAFAFLDGADLICMSVMPEMVGLRNSRLMLDQLLARGYPRERIWLILNRAGLPGGISLADLEAKLGTEIRYQVPNDQALATETINRGVPMAVSHRRSPVARACQGLARELTAELSPAATAGEPAPAALPVTRGLRPAINVRRGLATAVGIVGIVAAVRLLLPVASAPRSASGEQAIEPAGATITSQPASALSSDGEQAEPVLVARSETTPTVAVASVEVATATDLAPTGTPTQTASPSPSRTPSPTATASRSPEPTATPTASPSPEPTSTPTSTATDTPVPTPTRRLPSPTPRKATVAPPTPSSMPVILNAPVLLEPRPDESRNGIVKFAWLPVGPLPSGAAYEVVWWYAGEDPANARGIAATTTATSLTANLDDFHSLGQLQAGDLYWTVLLVQTGPYVRLTQPAQSGPQRLTYVLPSGPAAPPPPKPKD